MEKILRDLGFNDFVAIRKEKRDGVNRMAWGGILMEELWFILLFEENNKWFIEHLENGRDSPELLKKKYSSFRDPVSEILELIKKSKHGR